MWAMGGYSNPSVPPKYKQTRAFGRVFVFYIPKNMPKRIGMIYRLFDLLPLTPVCDD